jgi:preprotein translocase subunit YajC
MLISSAYAQTAGDAGGMAIVMQLAPLLLIFGVFYFLLIRPQQQKQKQHKELLSKLKRGDRVVTAGGILGRITEVKDGADEVEVEVAANTRIRVLRGSIAEVLKPIGANDDKG